MGTINIIHDTNKTLIKKKLKGRDEVNIFNDVQKILRMFPADVEFTIHYVQNKEQVKYMFNRIYGVKKNYIAFYSPSENTIYISVRNLKLKVLAHEICHVIITKMFGKRMPGRTQEVLCQWIERQI